MNKKFCKKPKLSFLFHQNLPFFQEDLSRPKTPLGKVLPRQLSVQDQNKRLDYERRQSFSRCKIRLQLYFNDILVCKTDLSTLQWDFCATFRQIYSLKVYEQPETVKLVVSEKFGNGAWRDLANVFVPFNWDNNTKLEPMEFASEVEMGSFKNSIGCGDPPKAPFLQGRLLCNAIWKEKEIPWNFKEHDRVSTQKIFFVKFRKISKNMKRILRFFGSQKYF